MEEFKRTEEVCFFPLDKILTSLLQFVGKYLIILIVTVNDFRRRLGDGYKAPKKWSSNYIKIESIWRKQNSH